MRREWTVEKGKKKGEIKEKVCKWKWRGNENMEKSKNRKI